MDRADVQLHKAILIQQVHGGITADRQFREKYQFGALLHRLPGKIEDILLVPDKVTDG
ncbi:hypothetical protein AGMMS50255_6690 [Spirochaetia bacterium]|nr:hypothetical protein AGMMS50255_6600 [Spirochaetia bacterium]GHV87373.1 hypothetical protein AGMMS50255_6690 [Spirochaetia bacterium]